MVKRITGKSAVAASSSSAGGHSHAQIEGKSALAKRVPIVRSNPDICVFNRQVIERNALVRILDKLTDDRSLAPKVWESLENNMITTDTAEERAKKEEMFFEARVLRIDRVDKEWLALWLEDASDNVLNKKVCDQIDGQDKDGLLNIFCCALAMTPQTLLPPQCQHRQTCWRMLKFRYAQKGKRLSSIKDAISEEGRVDWTKWAAYTLKFEDSEAGSLQKVTHIEGDSVSVDKNCFATRKFDLVEPWFDFAAKLQLGGTVHTFAGMFGPETGPFRNVLDKKGQKLKAMVATVCEEIEKETAQLNKGQASESGFLKAADAKAEAARKESLAHARVKLQQSMDNKRKVRFN